MHYIGIIDRPNDSIFIYGRSGSWNTFYKPDYTPLFEAKFNDLELEEEALMVNRLVVFFMFFVCIVVW